MKVLLTGANGQLGRSIQQFQDRYSDIDFTFTDLDELNITDVSAVKDHFHRNTYDYVLNCAAYTAVDNAEKESEIAFQINEQAVGSLAGYVQEQNGTLVHVSTDYVFSGRHYQPYSESDPASPESVYGKSKRAGEIVALKNCENTLIVRTSWLYSEYGKNFMKTMLRLGDEREVMNVVSDQVGTPTYARDLADVILQLVKEDIHGPSILHYSNEGAATWYDFAWEIIHLTKKPCRVRPIQTRDYPLPAVRPPYSLLKKEKITRLLQMDIPHWKESLKDCLKNLGAIH